MVVAFAAGACVLSTGCAQGVRWQVVYNPPVEPHPDHPLELIYFRSWYSVDCTRVEDKIFNAPTLGPATADLLCVQLDFDWDRPLARSLNVEAVPAFVIRAPDGRVLSRLGGEFSVDQVLATIEQARRAWAATSQPTSGP